MKNKLQFTQSCRCVKAVKNVPKHCNKQQSFFVLSDSATENFAQQLDH